MKWTLAWLSKNAHPDFTFDEAITFDPKLIKATKNLIDLKDVRVSGTGNFDEEAAKVHLVFKVKGVMVLPCAITLEPIEHHFNVDYDDWFSFNATDVGQDLEVVKGDELDIIALVYELIVISIPLKVVKEGAKYPQSNGNWSVVTEDELKSRKQDDIDPRLAKLKDYFK